MSLIDDLKKWYEDNSYPPEGPELDEPGYEGYNSHQTRRVAYERNGSLRWGESILVVYKRDDELVGVEDVEPATEMQDWGDYGTPEIYPVEAVEIKTTTYKKALDY